MTPRTAATTRPRAAALLGTAGLLALLAASPSLRAQDEVTTTSKRSEGRYFVELAEIMLQPHEFDVVIGTIDPGGPGAGAAAEDLVADLSEPEAEAPKITIGLNLPSGKTQISMSIFDFDRVAERVPQSFEDQSNVVTTYLLPPGWVFQRQSQPALGSPNGDDYVPNWGNEIAFVRRVDYQQGDFTLSHNIVENKHVRLRWTGGLRYAQLVQKLSLAMSFTKEYTLVPGNSLVVGAGSGAAQQFSGLLEQQDFYFFQSEVETHGIGPKGGLAIRVMPGKKKKWSFEAQGDVALIPESTSASYGLRGVDTTPELTLLATSPSGQRLFFVPVEGPLIPGISITETKVLPFAALVKQTDFTDTTYVVTGQIGFRFKPKDFFTVGLDLWQMRWLNVLSQMGVVDTAHRFATYEILRGDPNASDPQLRDSEAIVHLPRFTEREDFVFDGVSLNLTFDF